MKTEYKVIIRISGNNASKKHAKELTSYLENNLKNEARIIIQSKTMLWHFYVLLSCVIAPNENEFPVMFRRDKKRDVFCFESSYNYTD